MAAHPLFARTSLVVTPSYCEAPYLAQSDGQATYRRRAHREPSERLHTIKAGKGESVTPAVRMWWTLAESRLPRGATEEKIGIETTYLGW
jgi:hypothetical protein